MRRTVVLMLALFVSSCSCIHTGRAVVSRSRPVVMAGPGKPWETANVPRGKVVMNPFENLKQMQDQRVAGISHVNLAPGKCTLPLQEAIALMKTWKEEIGDDAEKFAERVSRRRHRRRRLSTTLSLTLHPEPDAGPHPTPTPKPCP